jgi:hypothetical protein
MKIHPTLMLGLSLLLTPAWADVVVLKDGRTLDGAVSVKDGKVVVRHRFGEVRVDEADVLRIEETDDAWDELERLRARLSQGTADERYQFAMFARENGFQDEARKALLSVLRVDTHHPGARSALGYVQHEGRWVTVSDRNAALGLVQYRGEWMTPEDKAERQADIREAAERKRQEKEAAREARREKREAEREARRERIRQYELELAKARARLRAEEENYDRNRGGIPYGTYYGGYYLGAGGVLVGTPYVPGRPGYPYRRCDTRPRSGYSSYYDTRSGSGYYRGYGASLGGYYDGGNWGLRWRFGY